jgi:uncharacterized membrane protein
MIKKFGRILLRLDAVRGYIILVSFGLVSKLAKVGREISLTEVEDLSILREAQKELGIKER